MRSASSRSSGTAISSAPRPPLSPPPAFAKSIHHRNLTLVASCANVAVLDNFREGKDGQCASGGSHSPVGGDDSRVGRRPSGGENGYPAGFKNDHREDLDRDFESTGPRAGEGETSGRTHGHKTGGEIREAGSESGGQGKHASATRAAQSR